MISHVVKLEALFYQEAYWLERSAGLEQGCSDSVSCHNLALPRTEVIHAIFSFFCLLCALAPFCRALWRKARGAPWGTQQRKFEINAPLEGICSFSQLEWNPPVLSCSRSARYLQLKVKKTSWTSMPPAFLFL